MTIGKQIKEHILKEIAKQCHRVAGIESFHKKHGSDTHNFVMLESKLWDLHEYVEKDLSIEVY